MDAQDKLELEKCEEDIRIAAAPAELARSRDAALALVRAIFMICPASRFRSAALSHLIEALLHVRAGL